jgi:hypothetical protein
MIQGGSALVGRVVGSPSEAAAAAADGANLVVLEVRPPIQSSSRVHNDWLDL